MISPETVEELFLYAQGFQPKEMCGLLLKPDLFIPCRNVADDPAHGFEIAHQDYRNAVRALSGNYPWATVHSHPNGPANLSGRDCQLLDALELVKSPMKMVIVGLKPMQIRIYSKAEGQYQVDWKWDLLPID